MGGSQAIGEKGVVAFLHGEIEASLRGIVIVCTKRLVLCTLNCAQNFREVLEVLGGGGQHGETFIRKTMREPKTLPPGNSPAWIRAETPQSEHGSLLLDWNPEAGEHCPRNLPLESHCSDGRP